MARYRSRHHNTFIGVNGSVRIQDLEENIRLDKPGADGRKTHELDKRGEVKLSTLKAAIKALGGTLEVRAHFPDADIPVSLATSK